MGSGFWLIITNAVFFGFAVSPLEAMNFKTWSMYTLDLHLTFTPQKFLKKFSKVGRYALRRTPNLMKLTPG